MLQHNSNQVWIEIDKKPLEEYEVKQDGHVATAWICSEAGKVSQVTGHEIVYKLIALRRLL